jgi:flagellar basal-body rod protein FlgB
VLDRLGQSIEVYLDLLVQRQKLVSSNLANFNTPGYRTRDVQFQQELNAALAQAANKPAAGAAPKTNAARPISAVAETVPGLVVKNDGNDVSLEREARLLAETAMRFQMATMMLERRVAMTKAAIREEVAG